MLFPLQINEWETKKKKNEIFEIWKLYEIEILVFIQFYRKTQPWPFLYVLGRNSFTLQKQNWIVARQCVCLQMHIYYLALL